MNQIKSSNFVMDWKEDGQAAAASMAAIQVLPDLTNLTLDEEAGVELTVQSLATMLMGAKKLQRLTIKNLMLTPGTPEEWKDLICALSTSRLREVYLHRNPESNTTHHQGSHHHSSKGKLSNNNSNKKKVCRASNLNACGILVELCLEHLNYLESLSLHNVMDRQQVYCLVDAIDENKLRRLAVTSAHLGEVAGDMIVEAMFGNTSISELTLGLGGDWEETQGSSIASLLEANKTLTKLHLRLVGQDLNYQDVALTASQIAKGLSTNESITHLVLETDILALQIHQMEKDVIQSFESMLQNNNYTIQELRLVDDADDHVLKDHPLSPEICMRLALNRSGLSKLLLLRQQNDDDTSSSAGGIDSYVKAMAKENNDINVLFTALRNNPQLF